MLRVCQSMRLWEWDVMFCRSRWLSASVTSQQRAPAPALIGSHRTLCRTQEYNEKNLHREQHKWSADNVKSGINANCHKRLGFQTKIMVARFPEASAGLYLFWTARETLALHWDVSVPAHQPQNDIKACKHCCQEFWATEDIENGIHKFIQ